MNHDPEHTLYTTESVSAKEESFKQKYGIGSLFIAFGKEEDLITWFDNNQMSFVDMRIFIEDVLEISEEYTSIEFNMAYKKGVLFIIELLALEPSGKRKGTISEIPTLKILERIEKLTQI